MEKPNKTAFNIIFLNKTELPVKAFKDQPSKIPKIYLNKQMLCTKQTTKVAGFNLNIIKIVLQI